MTDLDDAHERGFLTKRLCHNSVLKALENETLTPVLKNLIEQSALPLSKVETKFAVDSSGFCTTRYTRYFDVKYGVEKSEAEFVKVHICTGVVTNCVTAAEILGMHANDSPQLPTLVDATAEGFKIDEVSADKAYAGNPNFNAVHKHGGTLYAPFRCNTTGAVGGLFEKAFHFFQFHREAFLAKYHLRSNVESTFSAVKRTLGDSVRSKTDTAMKNEVFCKLIAWNLTCLAHAIYELGVVPVFWRDADEGDDRAQGRDVIRFPGVG